MDSGSQDLKVLTAPQIYNMDLLNGSQPAFPGQTYNGTGSKITLEQVDPSTFDDDSDDDEYAGGKPSKHGKKTRGRVKIKMEFIENKLRRYTTFSKRKTGIMKKAYELSTLTGTQVMLLVASETGHVYTFATRKLQPMITSESGKALIQTCLNSPDPPPMAPGQQQAVEQRMNPGGFEETELTYAVEEENGKPVLMEASSNIKPIYTLSGASQATTEMHGYTQSGVSQPTLQTATSAQGQQQAQVTTVIQDGQQQMISPQSNLGKTQNPGSISVQLPGLPPGFILQPVQTQQSTAATVTQPQQAVYHIPAPTQQIISNMSIVKADSGQQQQSNCTNAQTSQAMTPSVFMYQTPQGIVYAPATGPMQDKAIFSFQQPTHTITVSQPDANGGQQQTYTQAAQQIITIPVPSSLAGSQQLLTLGTAETPQRQEVTQRTTPTGAKKRKV